MKKLLLFISVLALFSCTEDLTENPAQSGGAGETTIVGDASKAITGALSIRVTPEMAKQIEASATRTEGIRTRSGVRAMDTALESIDVTRFDRIFPYDEEFEERHRAFDLHLWYTLRFSSNEDLNAAAQTLSRVAGVSAVQFKYAIKRPNERPATPYNMARLSADAQTRASEPMPMNDPRLKLQWHYSNDGSRSYNRDGHAYQAKAGADIDLFEAWKLCTGSQDIVVAVLDGAVQFNHPDLAANMWTNPNPTMNDLHGYNFYNQCAELDWKSSEYNETYQQWFYDDHGTHVAGTVAAVNGNGVGVCGVAGGANGVGGVKIMSCQIMGYNAENEDVDAAAKAFVYAADHGAVIAQCSWGYASTTTRKMWEKEYPVEKSSIDYFIKTAGMNNPNSPLKGGLVVFAAGNEGDIAKDKECLPAAYEPTIAVAAMAYDYTPAYYTDYGSWADITAPGGDQLMGDDGQILSTILEDPSMKFHDGRKGGYGFMQGTSMATPHVSGVAALALSYAAQLGKSYTVDEFKTLLLGSVNDINPYMVGTKDFLTIQGGWSTLKLADYKFKMGSGYTDAYKLLLAVKGTSSIVVKQNAPFDIALSHYFGGYTSYGTFTVSMSEDMKTKLGVTGMQIVDGKLTITCSKCGTGVLSIQTSVGGATISKEIALFVREQVASNGGWL
ncbi:MAG: S8 family serine peptidase [Alistipes sp.]